MRIFSVVGPLGPEEIDYGRVYAASALEALYTVHLDGLGKNAVRLADGLLVFADPADQEMCAGTWCVVLVQSQRPGTATLFEIPAPLPAAA